MKFIASSLIALILAGCSSNEVKKEPTHADQVAGLQSMCQESAPQIKKRQAKSSLYDRLGKREKISVFVSQLYDSHKNNKQIGHMFAHVQKAPFVGHVTEFLVVGTGGKGNYKGREMGSAHKHLKITNSDFLSAGGDVQNTMKAMNYGENEIQEVICALVSFAPVVVVKNQ